MRTVWLTIPSAREPAEAEAHLSKWRDMGYRIAVFRDHVKSVQCNLEARGKYPGYYASINRLAQAVLETDPAAEWVIVGGDDTDPDPHKRANEIADECEDRFRGTLGVMQPTGDRWGEGGKAYSERVAGSAWIGKDWCRRAYMGKGPMWGEYFHYYGDESLQIVAQLHGVFWQRQDLTHYHAHYMRDHTGIPSFHKDAARRWAADQTVFERRKAAGFPGHQLL